ncbi:hypothetical protein [Alcaligenes faecalis]|uniref:hypothetical protein n=1 Tax=Alcaligenes faecalis TaxID=511 RepID=UPI0034D7A575
MFNRFVVKFELGANIKSDLNDGVLLFDGVAYKNGRIFSSENFPKSIDDVINADIDGQWMSVVKVNRKKIVSTDFFGFYSIFYAIDGSGNLLVSNNYDALIQCLKDIGVNLSFDLLVVFPMLTSSYSFFDQAFSSQTGCAQIRRLLPNEAIEIYDNLWKIIKKSEKISEPYEDLISKGSLAVKRDLQGMSEMGFYNTQLSLSGGKDSRAVLALSYGAVPNLSIRTTPRFEDGGSLKSKIIDRDFEIALNIVSNYDLPWNCVNEVLVDPIRFDDALDYYRFFRSSNYYRTNLSRYRTSVTYGGSYVELAGGCGEVLRGFWGEYFKNINYGSKIYENRFNKKKCGNYVFAALVKKNARLEDYYQDSLSWFGGEIEQIDGQDFFEAIDNHYFLHRNRYHFGNQRDSWRAGKLLYYPLGKKEFFQASKSVSSDLKMKGKLVFDIINHNKSELHGFDYETPFAYSRYNNIKKNINIKEELIERRKKDFLNVLNNQKKYNKVAYERKSFDLKINLNGKFKENIEICRSNKDLDNILDVVLSKYDPKDWNQKDINSLRKLILWR